MKIIQEIKFLGLFGQETPDIVMHVSEMVGHASIGVIKKFGQREDLILKIIGEIEIDCGGELDVECSDQLVSDEFIYCCRVFDRNRSVLIFPENTISLQHISTL